MIFDIRRKGLVGTLVGHAVLLACLVVTATQADVATNQVISGWLQAIGSVLAIVFAIIVANTQYMRSEEAKRQANVEHCCKLTAHAAYICKGMEVSFSLVQNPLSTQADFDRHVHLLESAMRVYHAFSVDLIHSAEAFAAWMTVGHSCEDYIGHCRSNSGDLQIISNVRADNMKRCVERSNMGQQKLNALLTEMIDAEENR